MLAALAKIALVLTLGGAHPATQVAPRDTTPPDCTIVRCLVTPVPPVYHHCPTLQTCAGSVGPQHGYPGAR